MLLFCGHRTTSGLCFDMFSFVVRRFSAFAAVYLALQLAAVVAAPLEERDLEARSAPSAPHFVVYADAYQAGVTGPPPVSALKVRGITHFPCPSSHS